MRFLFPSQETVGVRNYMTREHCSHTKRSYSQAEQDRTAVSTPSFQAWSYRLGSPQSFHFIIITESREANEVRCLFGFRSQGRAGRLAGAGVYGDIVPPRSAAVTSCGDSSQSLRVSSGLNHGWFHRGGLQQGFGGYMCIVDDVV